MTEQHEKRLAEIRHDSEDKTWIIERLDDANARIAELEHKLKMEFGGMLEERDQLKAQLDVAVGALEDMDQVPWGTDLRALAKEALAEIAKLGEKKLSAIIKEKYV